MAEPLFVFAEVSLSSAAFRRWLALPSLLPSDKTGTSAGHGGLAVLDTIAVFLADECGPAAGNHLLCRYEKTLKELQFAAYFYDGSTADAERSAQMLADIVRSAALCRQGKGKSGCTVAHLADLDWSLASGEDVSVNDATQASSPPAWFVTWISALSAMGPVPKQIAWLDGSIRRAFDQCDRLRNASPANPVGIGWLHTDGERVYASMGPLHFERKDADAPDGVRMDCRPGELYVLEGANPRAMRQVDEFYYTDGRILWHFHASYPPEALAYCDGKAPRVYRFPDFSPGSLVVMGDTAWNAAYDDARSVENRFYVKATPIDGSTFEQVANTYDFCDRFKRYRLRERIGLCVENDCGSSDSHLKG